MKLTTWTGGTPLFTWQDFDVLTKKRDDARELANAARSCRDLQAATYYEQAFDYYSMRRREVQEALSHAHHPLIKQHTQGRKKQGQHRTSK